MAGYFFVLLGCYLAVRWNLPQAPLMGLRLLRSILTIGILSRENVASVLVFGLTWALLSRKFRFKIIVFAAIPILLAFLWSSYTGVSYLEWYMNGGLAFGAVHQDFAFPHRMYRMLGLIQYAFRTFPEILILMFLGLLQIRQKNDIKLHISLLIGPLVIIFAWPVIDVRFTFIHFPSIFSWAGLGLQPAFEIIFNSRLRQIVWPSFQDTQAARLVFFSRNAGRLCTHNESHPHIICLLPTDSIHGTQRQPALDQLTNLTWQGSRLTWL